jgi:Mrp family chromosome partitioning ATPase
MMTLATTPDDATSAFDEVRLRLLGAGLLSSAGVPNRIGLTAIGRGDGVSTVATGLASALALHADAAVLLVDGTPMGARIVGQFDDPHPPLRGDADLAAFDAACQRIDRLGIDLVAFADVPRPAALWGELGARYRHIVVDAGSLRGEAAHEWASRVDHLFLVIDSQRMTREALQAFSRELPRGVPRLAGFILNKRSFHVPARLYRSLT